MSKWHRALLQVPAWPASTPHWHRGAKTSLQHCLKLIFFHAGLPGLDRLACAADFIKTFQETALVRMFASTGNAIRSIKSYHLTGVSFSGEHPLMLTTTPGLELEMLSEVSLYAGAIVTLISSVLHGGRTMAATLVHRR